MKPIVSQSIIVSLWCLQSVGVTSFKMSFYCTLDSMFVCARCQLITVKLFDCSIVQKSQVSSWIDRHNRQRFETTFVLFMSYLTEWNISAVSSLLILLSPWRNIDTVRILWNVNNVCYKNMKTSTKSSQIWATGSWTFILQ